MRTSTEFLIHDANQADELLEVTGIVNKGEIQVGTHFTLSLDADGETTDEINLRVTAIQTYGHQLQELPQGMSGGLTLAGFCNRLRHNFVLIGRGR